MKNIRNILFIISMISVFSFTKAFSQSWQPVDGGVPFPAESYCVDGHDVYIGSTTDSTGSGSRFLISRWNGLFWTNLPVFVSRYSGQFIGQIFVFKGEVYVYGSFDSVVNLTGSHYMVRFDGNKWKDVDGGVNGLGTPYFITQIYKNKLYVANIHKAGSLTVSQLACWDGTKWSKVGNSPDGINANGYINKMVEFNNRLCVAGSFYSAGSLFVSNIAFWDETTWSLLGTTGNQGVNEYAVGMIVVNNNLIVYGSFTKAANIITNGIANWDGSAWHSMINYLKYPVYIGSVNNQLYLIGKDYDSNYYKFQIWNGNTWVTQPQIFDYYNKQSKLEFNNNLWQVGKFKFHNDPAYYNMIVYDGSSWKPFLGDVPGNMSSQRNLFKCHNYLYLAGSFQKFKDTRLNHITRLSAAKVGHISGMVFHDENIDCVKDSNEIGLPYHIIEIQPGNFFLNTNEKGEFDGYIDTGYKIISLAKNKGLYNYWELSPCNPINYKIHIKDTGHYSNNVFATYRTTGIMDLKIDITGQTGWRARKGFNETYYLNYENIGSTSVISGNIVLFVDPRVTLQSSSPIFDSNSGNIYTWNFSNLQPSEKRLIKTVIKIDTNNFEIGDTVKIYCNISPVGGESNSDDNFDTLFQKVVGAVDPNDKQCFPEGDIAIGTDEINYLIRFQNTGNDTAYRVIVIDTVETDHLPLTEIEIKTISHTYSLEVINNVLIWTFNNILLPDKNQDEPNSHGYIRYSAHILPGLASGTIIQNRAYIFFDYMPHVATNKTYNTIVSSVGINDFTSKNESTLKVFPNPASDKFYILNTGNTSSPLELFMYNELGQKIKSFKVKRQEIKVIDLSDIESGIYIILSNDGKFAEKIIVTK